MTIVTHSMDIPGVRETRVLLRARGILAQYSPVAPDRTDLQAIRALCQRRIQAVGVRQYVYDILGGRANWPARRFQLWYGDEMVTPDVDGKLVECLAKQNTLPDRVEIESKDDDKRQTFYITV